MELLVMWLGTVVVSFGMDTALAFKMFKDVADQGYKIDFKRFKEMGEQLNPDARKTNILGLFVPIVNILLKFDQMLKYNNARPFISDQLRIMDCIEPLTKDEEEDYSKKPTGLNAMVVAIKSEVNKDKDIKTVSFTDGEEKSSISYREDENGNRIIVKAEGPAARLSVIEQKTKIDEIFSDMAKALKERYTEEELRSVLSEGLNKKSGFTLDLNDVPVKEECKPNPPVGTVDTNLTSDISLSEQKQQLEQWKSYFDGTSTSNVEEEKQHTLGKKKK